MTIRMTAIRAMSSSTATSWMEPSSGASIWVRTSVPVLTIPQFLVYDFDGDGKAEDDLQEHRRVVSSGQGKFVSDAATDAGIR